jgi:hypothetical protein
MQRRRLEPKSYRKGMEPVRVRRARASLRLLLQLFPPSVGRVYEQPMAYEARQQGAVSQALPGDVQAPRLALRERRPRSAVRRSVRALRNLRIEGHCAPYSRSASPLSHADRLGALARLALALYASRSPGVTLTFIRTLAGSFLGGCPLRFGSMSRIVLTNSACTIPFPVIKCTHT